MREAQRAVARPCMRRHPARTQINVCRACLEDKMRHGKWVVEGARRGNDDTGIDGDRRSRGRHGGDGQKCRYGAAPERPALPGRRSLATLEKMFGSDPLADLAVWEPDDAATIRSALRGVTAVVYLVGVPYTDFHLHPILMRRVIEAAVAAKVDRLLLIGTLYVFGRPQSARITEDHPKEPHTFKGRKRKEQEDLVLAAHATNQIRTAVLRLPDFYGPGVERSLLSDLFIAAKQNRKAKLIGPIDRPHEFVFVPDVGPVVAKLLDTPAAFGRAWNLGGAGPSRLSLSWHRWPMGGVLAAWLPAR